MDDELGGRFWLKMVGMAIAIGIAGILLFSLIGFAWYAWGVLGTLLFFFVLIGLFAWLGDRRARQRTT
jgi:hypothetical protein